MEEERKGRIRERDERKKQRKSLEETWRRAGGGGERNGEKWKGEERKRQRERIKKVDKKYRDRKIKVKRVNARHTYKEK